jgi:hypothetical protein
MAPRCLVYVAVESVEERHQFFIDLIGKDLLSASENLVELL